MKIQEAWSVFEKQKIGKKIKSRRKYLSMSQEDLAKKVGTKQEGISRVEKGNFDSFNLIAKICEELGSELFIKLEFVYPKSKLTKQEDEHAKM